MDLELMENEEVLERHTLVMKRIAEIENERNLTEELNDYCNEVAEMLLLVDTVLKYAEAGSLFSLAEKKKAELHDRMFDRFSDKHYQHSFLNPAYAKAELGEAVGGELSFLYAELTATYGFAYEKRVDLVTVFSELFVEIYVDLTAAEEKELAIKQDIQSFYHDYTEIFIADEVRFRIDPAYRFCSDIVEKADLSSLAYLYDYGMPVGNNERGMAAYLQKLSEEEIQAMADTFTEGYRIGFAATQRDISIKKTVGVEYPLGMERVIRAAFLNFQKMGLKPVVVREGSFSATGRGRRRGCYSTATNRQFEYDHKEDKGFYYDKAYVERRLEVMRNTYEKNKVLARQYGGPAVTEIFGEHDFEPENKKEACHFTEKQNKLAVYDMTKAGEITNTYIPGDEYSFTIIAYPLPSIGKDFEKIFRKTVEINTLDYVKYQRMQQKLIDVLDKGEKVHITGKGKNHTDILVALHELRNPQKETNFENCVADVNIPVGECFTSPKLKGTTGVLHVSRVYLGTLQYKNLEIDFEDGKIQKYSCSNFEDEKENKKYIYDNILFHHETLPLGEFAIGTNTTAYKMARDFQIEDKMPILIAEKTGPHFAVGDTCYSHAEDIRVYNPDQKEIIARSNEIVDENRNEDPQKAYFNCHTDITIPYDELDEITVISKSGETFSIIKDGKFAVEGTEELNIPLND